MANEQNLRPPWKKGESGNPNGRKPMKARIAEMQEKLGDFPRTELMRMANDQRIKAETRARILMHLDDQFTGRPLQKVDSTNVNHHYVVSDEPITEDKWEQDYVTEH